MNLEDPASHKMALVQASIDSGYGPSHVDDPFDWTVEEVVYSLCSPNSPVLGMRGILSSADRDGLANTLQEEQIDGEALLTAITTDILRNDLGVKALGVRAKIINLIERLQHQSFKYQQKLERKHASESRLSSVQMSRYNTPSIRSPEHRSMHGQKWSSGWNYEYSGARSQPEQGLVLPQFSPAAANVQQVHDISSKNYQAPIDGDESFLTIASKSGQETTFIDEKGRQRRRLALATPTATNNSIQVKPAGSAEEGAPQELQYAEETSFGDPGLQNLDHRSCLPSAAESCSEGLVSEEQPGDDDLSHNIPGTDKRIDERQRKRIQPTQVGEPVDDTLANHIITTDYNATVATPENRPVSTGSSLGKRAKRAVEQMYFGPSAFHVDDIFYSDTTLGNIIRDQTPSLTIEQQELSLNSSSQVSDAQRLWVNSKMKYFFRSTTSNLHVQGGGQEIGIIPYPDRLGKRNKPLSMTVVTRSVDGISARRMNRSKWYATMSSTKLTNDTKALDSFGVLDPVMAVDSDNRDWDALEKWKYRDDDEVLPVYGNSGSEGEYDLETWREMEAENGKIARPEGRSRSRKLTSTEVQEAIDAAVKLFRDEWQRKKRPKIQHKAWRYWAKARRDHTTEVQIEGLSQRLVELEARISRIRNEITKEEWSKVDQIIRQAKIVQPSVFEQEECQWRLGILQSKLAPQKLSTPPRKPHRIKHNTAHLQDGEENLDSEASPTASEETDDDLNDFVVDDEIDDNDNRIVRGEEDTTMADDEEAIESDTLVISPSDVPPLKKEANASPETPMKTAVQPGPALIETSNFIDLTQVSDSLSSPITKAAPARIVTPPLFHPEEDSDAWFRRSRGKKPVFKHPPSVDAVPVVDVDTNSDESILLRAPTSLPPHHNVKGIRELNPTDLVERQDRRRLLVWLIAHAHQDIREQTIKYLDRLDMGACLVQVKAGLKKLKAKKDPYRGKDSESIMQVAAWYVGYTIPVKLEPIGISIKHVRITLRNDEGFEEFYEYMLEYLSHYRQSSPTKSTPNKRKKEANKKKEVKFDPSDSSSSVDPRKFASGSQETIQKRDSALQRMREDNQRAEQRAQREARQKELMPRLYAMSTMQKESSEIILNPGKLDEQDFIKLNSNFGRGAQLKPHQRDGLRFMWREITGEHKDLQGCLLAQTMGLGKTIQVIALLVAISDAVKSSSEGIRNQVPIELHRSQTLVLCPPALIENWWDEFLMWPPTSNHLGELRKVSASMKPDERIREILLWSQEGGVLLMGYSTFRDLLQNKPREPKTSKPAATSGPARLSDRQHRDIRTALLQKPNLVVADEAHEFKNQKSSINQVINQIKCKSRIALTGSPLSNNLGEYFVTIDWIAPGYLGTYSDFKGVYEDPIQDGLYQDQKPERYRESRKRLKALELELEPKIHRADLSALHGSLSGKSEFVVRVPLTTFQNSLYRDFVTSIRNLTGDTDRNVRTATLWSYLSVLQLLCNHPGSFHARLQTERQSQEDDTRPNLSQNNSRGSKAQKKHSNLTSDSRNDPSLPASDEDIINKEPLPKTLLSLALDKTQKAFNEIGEASNALHLSNKMQAVMRIIELSETAGDKVLVFSHRLDTLDYIGNQLEIRKWAFHRIDGKTPTQKRQDITKSFNEGPINVCLISTRAGGQGLNMFGGNRVVILDRHFNPMWEQQAVGRAYRIGQKKHVFVYRLTAAGTFEEEIQDQALFKEQLATRVLEKNNPNRIGLSGAKQYLFEPKDVEKSDIARFVGKDPLVLDHLLADQERTPIISITPSETFYADDGQPLTAQENKEAEQMLKDEQLRRRDPERYYNVVKHRNAQRNQSMTSGTASSTQPNQPKLTYNALTPQSLASSAWSSTPSTAPPNLTKDLPLLAGPAHGLPGPFDQTSWHAHGIPRINGGPVVSAPAADVRSQIDDIEAQLTSTVSKLLSSSTSLAKGQQASKSLRTETRSNIFDLLLRRGSSKPEATDSARNLSIMISKHAKDEEDYRRLWRGIRMLLEREDVDPNTLLKVMIAKLRQPDQMEPESMRSDGSFAETAPASRIEEEALSAIPPGISPKPPELASKLDTNFEHTATLGTAPTEPIQIPDELLGETETTKRPQTEATESERPTKKTKSSIWVKPASAMAAVGGQFERLLAREAKRP